MKKNYAYYYIIVIVFSMVFTSCKKEELPDLPDENGPYYHISGLVNNDSVKWQVGVDNTWITYGQSTMNGVGTYYGQITSGITGDAIKIELIRPELYTNGTEITALSEANTKFLVHKPGAVKFNFGMNYEQFNYVLIKNQDGMFQAASQVAFDAYGIYDVCVKFADYSLTESFILPVKYGFEDNLLNAGFTSTGDGNMLVATANTNTGDHQWFVDGNLVSHESVLTFEMTDGVHEVKHELKDTYGNEGSYTTLIRFKTGSFYWQMKYFYVPPAQPSSNFGNVIVSMKKNGTWYYSDKASVNLDNKFTVSNIVTEISASENTGKTLFDFVFASTLYSLNQSDSLYLPEMTGRMAIEFK